METVTLVVKSVVLLMVFVTVLIIAFEKPRPYDLCEKKENEDE
jgi:hypothetical protein